MTIKEWMRNKYFEHGKEWLKTASEKCQEEVGHNYSAENWNRAVRRVVSEFEGREDELGEVAKVFKEENLKEGKTFYEVTAENIRTLEDLVNFCEIDTDMWECTKIVSNRWGGYEKPMWQVKGWFSRKTEANMTPEEYAKRFKELTSNYTPPTPKPKKPEPKGDMLLEVSLYDIHYGQLSWGPETGSENYDIKIAADLYERAVDHFIDVSGDRIGKFLLVVGNDFFNSDNHLNTTTNLTPQVEDTRWQKTFLTAEKLIIDQIEKMRGLGDVDIVIVPGNHDRTRIFYFGEFLKAWYRDCDDVFVDNNPNKHKYYEYGNTMLMLTHGDNMANGALPLFMVQDQPEMYARAKYREIHKGHFHSGAEKKYQLSKNTHGITEVTMPSLTARDDWHNMKGYGSERQSLAIAWTKDKGRYATYYFSP